jgi:hypothetical protein
MWARARGWLDERPLRRFKLAVGAALLVLAMGNGLALTEIHASERAACLDRNRRAEAAAPAFQKLVRAHRLDHDPHATAVWQEYLDAAQHAPLPTCR